MHIKVRSKDVRWAKLYEIFKEEKIAVVCSLFSDIERIFILCLFFIVYVTKK